MNHMHVFFLGDGMPTHSIVLYNPPLPVQPFSFVRNKCSQSFFGLACFRLYFCIFFSTMKRLFTELPNCLSVRIGLKMSRASMVTCHLSPQSPRSRFSSFSSSFDEFSFLHCFFLSSIFFLSFSSFVFYRFLLLADP